MEEVNLEANNSLEPSNPNELNQAKNNGNNRLPSAWNLLEESWQIFVGHWETFIELALVMFSAPILIALAVPILNQFYPKFGLMFLAFISPIFLILLLLSSWGMVSLACAAKNPDLGLGELLKEGWRKIIPYWWIIFLQGIIISAGYALFFIPGLIFSVWFSLAMFIFIAEDIKGMDALLKSKEYVKGYWGSVFWRLIFLLIVSYLIIFLFSIFRFAIGLPNSHSLSQGLLSLFEGLIDLIILPVSIIYIYRIYFYLKKIKKDLIYVPNYQEKIFFIVLGILGLIVTAFMLFVILGFIVWNYQSIILKPPHFI